MREKVAFLNTSDQLIEVENSKLMLAQWEYLRNGGCSDGRFLMNINLDSDDLIHTAAKKTNMAVYIKSESGDWETRYNGYISQLRRINDGGRQVVEMETFGYKNQLQRFVITAEPTYPATVAEIITELLDTYITPNTTITYNVADISGSFSVDDLRLVDMTVLEAIELLSAVQGGYEWGINPARQFYHKEVSTNIGQLEAGHDNKNYIEHSQLIDPIANRIRLYGGFLTTGSHYARTTSNSGLIYACGLREHHICIPSVVGNTVADQLNTNLLAIWGYPQTFIAYSKEVEHFDWLEYKQPIDKVKTFFKGISGIVNADLLVNAVKYKITGKKNLQMVELGSLVNNTRGLQSYV